MCGAEISDLQCLALGINLNLTSDDMDDIWRQGIDVNNGNDPAPKKYYFPLKNDLNTTGRGLQFKI